MQDLNHRTIYTLHVFSYLLLLGCSLYFSKGLSTVPPSTFLVLILSASGLILGTLLLIASRRNSVSGAHSWFLWSLFSILQSGLGFFIAWKFFSLPIGVACAFPVGALGASLSLIALEIGTSTQMRGLGVAALLALTLTLGLRLAGIWGGLVAGLAVLNGFWLGWVMLREKTEARLLWCQAMAFFVLLSVGRAAIQYYLLQSNYATLGVVITHPYTYAALFAGCFLPFLSCTLDQEKILGLPLKILFLGILLPLSLGVFFHVRPMGAYLLGLVTISFLMGLSLSKPWSLLPIAYCNMASIVWGLSLFQKLNNLSRISRIQILTGLFILVLGVVLALKHFSIKKGDSTA